MFPTPQNFSHNILATAASVIWGQGDEPPLDVALWLQGCSLGCLLHRYMSPCTGSAWQAYLQESDTLVWKSHFLGHITSLVFPPLFFHLCHPVHFHNLPLSSACPLSTPHLPPILMPLLHLKSGKQPFPLPRSLLACPMRSRNSFSSSQKSSWPGISSSYHFKTLLALFT